MWRCRLSHLLAWVSLLLFVGTLAAAVRSHFTQTVVTVVRGDRLFRLHVKENGLVVAAVRGWRGPPGPSWRSAPSDTAAFAIPVLFDGRTFATRHWAWCVDSSGGPGVAQPTSATPVAEGTVTGDYIVVRWPLPVAVTSALAAGVCVPMLAGAVRRRRRRSRGGCSQCGYDLRATPGQCPECGRAPAVA